jgi:hypothetical protein
MTVTNSVKYFLWTFKWNVAHAVDKRTTFQIYLDARFNSLGATVKNYSLYPNLYNFQEFITAIVKYIHACHYKIKRWDSRMLNTNTVILVVKISVCTQKIGYILKVVSSN